MAKSFLFHKFIDGITPLQKVQFVLFGFRAHLALQLEQSRLSLEFFFTLLPFEVTVFAANAPYEPHRNLRADLIDFRILFFLA